MQRTIFKVAKSVLALVICITMLFSLCMQSLAATEKPNEIAGDVDGDGNVNLNDLITLAQYVAEWENIEYNPYALDVNGDGDIDLEDVNHLAQWLVGWYGDDEDKKPAITLPDPVTYTPTANKIYNKKLVGGEFNFTLEGEINGTKVEQEKTNSANGTITFDALSFPKVGTYTFTVREINKILGFIEYSTAEHTLVIDVIYTNGVLSVSSVTVNGDADGTIEFTNIYLMDGEDEVTLRGTTVLTGDRIEVTENEFEFGLYNAENTLIESVKNDANGNFAFSTLNFDENNTEIDGEKQFTYTIKEIAGNNARYTYDESVYTVVVTVADNDQGGVTASYTVNGAANGEIKFTNHYSNPAPVTYTPTANKIYNKKLVGGEFEFTLEGEINGTKVEQEKTNSANGTITFDALSFPEAGTYTFTVKEINKILGFIEYSTAEHILVVNVIDTNGVLNIESVTVNGDADGTIEFTNTYLMDGEDEVTLRGTTVLTGDRIEVTENEFEFGLYNAENTLIESVKNDANGNFAFSTLKFDENNTEIDGEKQFTYTIKEIAGNNARYTYDESVYTVVVTVADNDQGGVTASYTVNGAANGEIKFTNHYSNPAPVAYTPTASKIYNKKLVGGEFNFTLEGEINGTKVEQEKTNSANGTITFDALSFPEAGSYTFTVEEINKILDFIEYSTAEHTLVVNVIDTNGVLSIESVTVNGDADGTIVFENVYTFDANALITIKGNTVLTGDRTDVTENEFEFGLYNAENALIKSVKNDANGNFEFSVNYNANDIAIDGETQFTYTIKEIKGDDICLTYDESVYTVVVTLKDNNEGGVTASYTANDEIKFTNVYTAPDPEEKFVVKFPETENFVYRLGNANAVALESLFALAEGVETPAVDSVTVDVANAEYTVGSSWEKGTIDFADDFTGVATITINMPDDRFCSPTELTVEVVDAVNATSAANATANNVVLLQDAGFGSLEVSNGYTLYGNGFTLTCGSDSVALNTGYEFVAVNNGILDNVQIVTPNFDYAVLYSSNMTESGNRSETTDKTRYYNVRSAVEVNGNSQILNSRISGGRAALNVVGGNLVVDNSSIELGAVASLLVGAANSVTLRDVTLIQKPTASTYDPSKILMGFSALAVCDAEGDAAPITIEGELLQYAWVDENDKGYVPSAGESIISTVLGKTDYLHDLDGDGVNESLNLGFAYMPESLTSKVNATTITDNRTNKDAVPYDYAEISVLSGKTYVYSYKNANGTDDSFKTEPTFTPNKYSDIITVNYADVKDGLEFSKSFETNGWVYVLNVDLDKVSGYALDFDKLSIVVNGVTVNDYTVNGSAKPTAPVSVISGGVTYTLTANVDGKEHTIYFKVIGTETSKESPSKISGPTAAGFGVSNSYGGDWSGAVDVLSGVKIKYWSVAESQYKEIDFSTFNVPGNAGKLNGTNSYWEYTHTNNDFTLKLTNTVAMHDKSQTFGMPVKGADGKMYFTISATGGFVSSGTSSRSITMKYEFTDNNGGEKLVFTHAFSIAYNKDNQYKYNDLVNSGTLTKLTSSGGGSSGCVTPDTLITLADGTQKRVDSLTGDELLLVWNLETGKYEAAPIVFVDSDAKAEYEVVRLTFSNGSKVNVISEHGFFDINLGKYVYIDATNYNDYIGHTFVTEGDITSNSFNTAILENVVVEKEVTTAWSPVTFKHLCYYTNGVLSMPGGIDGLFNIFEVDTDTMTYNAEKMQKDIETYGLFTLEDFGGLIPEIAFEAFNGNYLKVALAKGMLTWEDIAYMAERYVPLV